MKTKIIRRFGQGGRLTINQDIINYLQIDNPTDLAICRWGEDELMIRKLDDVENCEILAIRRIDSQGRIIIPKEIRQEMSEVRMYVMNKCLILEEAH